MATTAKKAVAKKAPAKRLPKATAATDTASVTGAALGTVAVASVPDPTLVKRYVNRDFAFGGKKMRDFDVYDYAYENGFNVLNEGPTGPGKTMGIRAWAAYKGLPLARVNSNNGIEKSVLFGKYLPDGTGEHLGVHFRWVDGQVTHVIRHGGVLLINELNFIPERVGSILFGVLDDNREVILDDKDNEVVRAHRGKDRCWCDEKDCDSKRVLIVGDMNPDYQGTRELNKAFRNRWAIQLVWDYDPNVEEKLILSEHLRTLAGQLRDEQGRGMMSTPVSTNMLMEFEQMAMDINVEFAIMNFVNHFSGDERAAVALVCDTHKENIAADLGSGDDDEESDDDDTNGDDNGDNDFGLDNATNDWLFGEAN